MSSILATNVLEYGLPEIGSDLFVTYLMITFIEIDFNGIMPLCLHSKRRLLKVHLLDDGRLASPGRWCTLR